MKIKQHLRHTAIVLITFFMLGTAAGADLALVGGTVYGAPGAAPVRDAVVLIHGSRIGAMGPRRTVRIPKDAQVVDCAGKFITAGFWNSHVHLLVPVDMDRMFNQWGFTTVFDIASVGDTAQALRRRIGNGEIRGPRILTTGEPLWTEPPVYIRGYLEANHFSIPVVTTPEEAAARVRALAAGGVDGIKLFTGSVQEGRVANMPLEIVRAATEEAHRHHLPVFAHPQNQAGVEAAIEGGVDILAHTVPDSPPWTAAFVGRVKRRHMALIPTLTLFDSEARKAGVSDAEREAWITKMVAELHAFSQGGGEVLFGTDIGYTDHYDTALECRLMARAGMTFAQVLASLTTAPAKRFGGNGKVMVGGDADLVVLDGNPERDIAALSKVWMVVRAGAPTYSAK